MAIRRVNREPLEPVAIEYVIIRGLPKAVAVVKLECLRAADNQGSETRELHVPLQVDFPILRAPLPVPIAQCNDRRAEIYQHLSFTPPLVTCPVLPFADVGAWNKSEISAEVGAAVGVSGRVLQAPCSATELR